jgi:hypothetical protein
MSLNFERGITRIVWVISLFGVMFGLFTAIYGSVIGISQWYRNNKFQEVLIKVYKDKDYIELTKSEKEYVISTLEKRYKVDKTNVEWKSLCYGGIIISVIWFILIWMLFGIIRWIISGFINDNK